MGKLTDRQVVNAKAPDGKDLFVSDGDGLYLRVLKNTHTKTWLYRYKTGTTTKWIDLGVYPALPLVQARAATLSFKMLRANGIDPYEQQEREAAKRRADEEALKKAEAAAAAHLNVRKLHERWEATELWQRKDSGAEIRRSFEKDVFPAIAEVAEKDIKRAIIARILDDVVLRGSPIIARNLLEYLRQMFSFAIKRGLLENDPTSHLKRNDFGKKVERDRVLGEDEIRELLHKLPGAALQRSTELALWIMLSTCCRVGELSRAQWADVDLASGTWHIPAENAKNGKAHVVFLSEFSFRHFQQLHAVSGHTKWCYPAENKDDSHVYTKSISKQVHDRQRTVPMKNRSKATGTLLLSAGAWTPHDLRRTGATTMGTLGVRPDVIEKCLNHVEQNKLVRAYQRQELKEEQRNAWKLLGERVDQVTSAKDNVVLLLKAA
jgi:integrase